MKEIIISLTSHDGELVALTNEGNVICVNNSEELINKSEELKDAKTGRTKKNNHSYNREFETS